MQSRMNAVLINTSTAGARLLLSTRGISRCEITDLSTLVGHDAKVHYTEANGTKTATSISVAGMAAAKKPKTEKPAAK